MKIKLAYGKQGMEINLPDSWDVTVVEPEFVPGLPDERAALRQALETPMNKLSLKKLVKATDRVGIVFSDITRPSPSHLLVPAILEALPDIPQENIVLFNALGTHRENTDAELRKMLNDTIVDHYRIVQNNCLDYSSQVYLGKTSRGTEMWINREFMECDVHILTGFIEPHIFAGFSGYGKSVLPGMAGLKTIVTNHGYHNLKHPKATWGITWGNPNWEEIREVTLAIGNLFLLNVTLNKNKQITGVYAGDPDTAHSAGVEQVRQHAMVALPEPFDIVITTNSGYPLDLNLYQSIKGNSAAAQIIRPGGSIILAAECWDGIPEHGLYAKLLREAESPQSLLDEIGQPGYEKLDQWTVQLQAQIFTKADVYVRNDYLSDEQLRSVKFLPCHNIEEKAAELVEKIGPQARICVLPEGPQTIPYIEPVTV